MEGDNVQNYGGKDQWIYMQLRAEASSMIQRLSDHSNETQESCWKSEQFLPFAVIMIEVKYWNRFANIFLFSFSCCFVKSSELSAVNSWLSSDSDKFINSVTNRVR